MENVYDVNLPDPAEIDAILAAPESSEEIPLTPEERALATKVLPALTKKIVDRAEAENAKKVAAYLEELGEQNRKMVEDELERIRKESAPINPQDMEKILSQEYLEFKLKLHERTGNVKEFVIRELPQAAEMKFIKNIQKTLVPRLKELSSIEWKNSMTMNDKIQTLVEAIPEVMDMLAEDCAICLDPYETDGITKEWVQKNLSSFRIVSVIEAQVAAGRFRDFFSAIYRTIPS